MTTPVSDERLIEVAKKYSIPWGSTHYFTKGHPSGLGGTKVYFPTRLGKAQCPVARPATKEPFNSEANLQKRRK